MYYNADISTPLCEIMAKNKSDKGNPNIEKAWHNYTILYYDMFKDLKDKNIRIFEIGIGANDPNIEINLVNNSTPGASLYGWAEFFPNALIFGADIDQQIMFEFDRIKTYYCDQTDSESIKKLWCHSELNEDFDIIIDDALHTVDANKCFFENSIHKLKKGGFFIIEDIDNYIEKHKMKLQIKLWEKQYPHLSFQFISLFSYWNDLNNNLVVIHYV
jgi:hypothetical protein